MSLGYNLRGAVGLLADAVPDEDGIGDAHEAVVDAVGVHVKHLARFEIAEDSAGLVSRRQRAAQGCVESAVAVWRDGDVGLCVEQDLAVHCETRKRSCKRGLAK